MRHTVSSRQVCCDGRGIPPLETGVQPVQASPCVQDLRCIMLHTFAFIRVPNMLLSPLGFPARLVGCPKRYFALHLLLLWSYLAGAEAAHSLFPYLFSLL